MTPRGISFRPYQLEAHDAVRSAWESGEDGHPMLVLPTGCGKTLTALALVAEAMERGERVAWVAHRTELLTQPLAALMKVWPEHGRRAGIVQASKNEAGCRCVFASVDTLRNKRRRLEVMEHGAIDLLVVDEAHHSAASTHARVIRGLDAGRRLGLTATPHREDGKDLGEEWSIAYSYSVSEAIAAGYLVPPMAAVVPVPDVDPKALAAMDDDAQGEALIAAHVVEHTVAALQSPSHLATALPERGSQAMIRPEGRRWFVFTASVRQAELTATALRDAGISAAAASGTTSPDERSQMLADLSAGRLAVLASPMIFTEGTDCPAVDGVVLARACSGWSTYVQCVGRGLRLHPGKSDCLVVDFSGATSVHDLRAAPILLGGSVCPDALDGVHLFEPDDKGRAICEACGKRLPCFAAMGPHRWDPNHTCKACGKPQCEESPDRAHEWIRAEDVQICLHCGAETKIRTPMVRKLDASPVEAEWVRIPYLDREMWGVRAGEHGTVLIAPDRQSETAEAWWIRHRGRKPRKLTPGPVPSSTIRAWCDDVVRRAAKLVKPDAEWKRRRVTATMARHLEASGLDPRRFSDMGEATRALTRKQTRDKAIKAGLAKAGTEQWA